MIAKRPEAAVADSGYSIGSESLIRLTPPASRQVATLLSRRGLPSGILRISVVGGGCSGFSYKMDLLDQPQNRDIIVESAGIRVAVDPKSAEHLTGSELDYVEGLMESGFRFRNPKAKSTCSCGDSFGH
jgi:iron-sulfur cluster assembly accessory protein